MTTGETEPKPTPIDPGDIETRIGEDQLLMEDTAAILRMQRRLGLDLLPEGMTGELVEWSKIGLARRIILMSDFKRLGIAGNRDRAELNTIMEGLGEQADGLRAIYGKYFPEAEL